MAKKEAVIHIRVSKELKEEIQKEAKIREITVTDLLMKGFKIMKEGQYIDFKQIMEIMVFIVGDKASDDSKEADMVAIMRTTVVLVNFATCFFIVAGIIRHW